jgi:hypothetical protein
MGKLNIKKPSRQFSLQWTSKAQHIHQKLEIGCFEKDEVLGCHGDRQ